MKNVPVYGIEKFDVGQHEHLLYANDLRIHLEDHKFVNSHHAHSTYVCVVFTQGTGQHVIDFTTYPVTSGSVFLLNPGQVHCWSLSDDVEGYVFFHTKELYESVFLENNLEEFPFFRLGQNSPVIKLEQSHLEKIIPLFEEITYEFRTTESYKNSKIASLINLVYIDLARVYQNNDKVKMSTHYASLKRLQKLIDEHFKQKKLPRDYAEMMNMTTRHLSRICAETVDTSPTELIQERVLIEAKRMLIHSDVTISYVADELGYEDYSYFIRLFKKKVGVSPKEFQKRTKSV